MTTYVDGAAVKSYHLKYKAAQDLSQLETIAECAGEGEGPCKAPTSFKYEADPPFTLGNGYDLTDAVQLDANGDGIPDFVTTIGSQDGLAGDPVLQGVQIASDVGVAVATSFAATGVGIGVSIAWTLVEPAFWGLFQKSPAVHISSALLIGTGNRQSPTNAVNASGLPCGGGFPTYVFDFNRDGRDDLSGLCLSPPALRLSLSNGDGKFSPYPSNDYRLLALPLNDKDAGPPPVIFDANGDGLEDILSCRSSLTLELRLRTNPLDSSASEYSEPVTLGSPLPALFCKQSRPTYNIFDIDGDGVADLLLADRSTGKWYVLRYAPASPAGPAGISWKSIAFDNADGSQDGNGLRLGDVNGDGLVDIAADLQGVGRVDAWISTGNGKFVPRSLKAPKPVFDPGQWPQGLPTFRGDVLFDYNADGMADFLEHWENPYPYSYNVALSPNLNFSLLTPHETPDIQAPDVYDFPFPASFALAADADGDGNRDLMGPSGVFYGGSKKQLLSLVVDGLGNFVGIGYDGEGTYEMDCTGPTWPETCVKRMNGLVSAHTEGFMGSDGSPVIERRTTYRYRNARVNVTGQGWLGFDQRQEIETALDGSPGEIPYRTTTIEYQAPARFSLGGQPMSSVAPPYVYPL